MEKMYKKKKTKKKNGKNKGCFRFYRKSETSSGILIINCTCKLGKILRYLILKKFQRSLKKFFRET